MDRNQVARILEEIAAMLELAGENVFKMRAYENGARAILSFPGDLEEAVRSRELLTVPGIGSGLFASIETLFRTGSLSYYDELRARFPPGLRECLRIPGLGAGLRKPLKRVVVGQSEGLQPGVLHLADEPGRGVQPIGNRGVAVQIDSHVTG